MKWLTKTFEDLLPGDILNSVGAHRWLLLRREGDEAEVLDLNTGDITKFKKRRDYWRFLVETS